MRQEHLEKMVFTVQVGDSNTDKLEPKYYQPKKTTFEVDKLTFTVLQLIEITNQI